MDTQDQKQRPSRCEDCAHYYVQWGVRKGSRVGIPRCTLSGSRTSPILLACELFSENTAYYYQEASNAILDARADEARA